MFQFESEDKKIRCPSSKNIKQENSWYPSLKTIRKEVFSLIKEGQPFCFIQALTDWWDPPTLGRAILFAIGQLLSHVQIFVTPQTTAHQASLSFTSPRVFSNSYLLSQWCHPTISSSVTPFSSCPQSFLVSRYFPMNWLFTLGGQSTGASASASVLLINI